MNLDQLKTLSDVKYQHSKRSLSVLLARENELRTELKRLRSLARETLVQSPDQVQTRAIGADVIWMKWLGQTQRHLNTALAQVLAQKEALMTQHRRAHGRKIVAENLANQALDTRAKNKRSDHLQTAIDQSLIG